MRDRDDGKDRGDPRASRFSSFWVDRPAPLENNNHNHNNSNSNNRSNSNSKNNSNSNNNNSNNKRRPSFDDDHAKRPFLNDDRARQQSDPATRPEQPVVVDAPKKKASNRDPSPKAKAPEEKKRPCDALHLSRLDLCARAVETDALLAWHNILEVEIASADTALKDALKEAESAASHAQLLLGPFLTSHHENNNLVDAAAADRGSLLPANHPTEQQQRTLTLPLPPATTTTTAAATTTTT